MAYRACITLGLLPTDADWPSDFRMEKYAAEQLDEARVGILLANRPLCGCPGPFPTLRRASGLSVAFSGFHCSRRREAKAWIENGNC